MADNLPNNGGSYKVGSSTTATTPSYDNYNGSIESDCGNVPADQSHIMFMYQLFKIV